MKSYLVTLTKQRLNSNNDIIIHKYLCQYLACGKDINIAIHNAITAANKEYPNKDCDPELTNWDCINSTDPTMNFIRSVLEVPPILNPESNKKKTAKVFFTDLEL